MSYSNSLMALGAVGSLILAFCIAILGLTARSARRSTRMEVRIEMYGDRLTEMADESRRERALIRDEMKEDRHATNERLMYLERQRMSP